VAGNGNAEAEWREEWLIEDDCGCLNVSVHSKHKVHRTLYSSSYNGVFVTGNDCLIV